MTGTQGPGLLELIGSIGDDPHRPVLVCHLPGGARTELSGASLTNWTAKVAGLLRDELGLGPGDTAAVLPATGWQVAPVLLGCWWAGLSVTNADDPSAAVAFVEQGGDAGAGEVFVLSGHPLGAPATGVADHQRDFTTSVLPQSDRLGAAARAGDGWTAAWDAGREVTAAELLAAAATVAEHAVPGGVPDGDRPVLISTLPWTIPDGAARTLLATLVAGGSLVQCPSDLPADALAAIAASEHATISVGVDLPGLAGVAG